MVVRWCRALTFAGVVALGGSCQPTVLGPTVPSGYRITVPEASQTIRAHPLALTVHVRDAAGQLVDDVLVQFVIPDHWASQARVEPPTVATRQGQATTTFRARTAGQMQVQITVEDRTVHIPINVVGDIPRF